MKKPSVKKKVSVAKKTPAKVQAKSSAKKTVVSSKISKKSTKPSASLARIKAKPSVAAKRKHVAKVRVAKSSSSMADDAQNATAASSPKPSQDSSASFTNSPDEASSPKNVTFVGSQENKPMEGLVTKDPSDSVLTFGDMVAEKETEASPKDKPSEDAIVKAAAQPLESEISRELDSSESSKLSSSSGFESAPAAPSAIPTPASESFAPPPANPSAKAPVSSSKRMLLAALVFLLVLLGVAVYFLIRSL